MINYLEIRDFAIRSLNPVFNFEARVHNNNQELINTYKEKNELLRQCKFLLIGDSHTYAVRNFFLDSGVVNVAINGETTSGILSRMEKTILNIATEKVIIQLGYNDFKYRSVISALSNYNEILGKFNAKTIFIISLFPVTPKRRIINNNIIHFNKLLMQRCQASKQYKYVDIFSDLYNPNHKGLDEKFDRDGVHLNEEGNKIYLKHLDKIINSNNTRF